MGHEDSPTLLAPDAQAEDGEGAPKPLNLVYVVQEIDSDQTDPLEGFRTDLFVLGRRWEPADNSSVDTDSTASTKKHRVRAMYDTAVDQPALLAERLHGDIGASDTPHGSTEDSYAHVFDLSAAQLAQLQGEHFPNATRLRAFSE